MSTCPAPLVLVELSSDLAAGNDESGPAPVDADVPNADFVQRWVAAALAADDVREVVGALDSQMPERFEVSVHLTDTDSSQALNRDFRDADKPTNVLSFSAGLPTLDGTLTLGELVLCADVVQREAREQGKAAEHHWAHLLVHGTLHLAGYDHIDDDSAGRMEAVEIRLLSEAGIPDPYRGTA